MGKIIQGLRKEKKMTLLELSEKSGVALATLSRIENGKMTGRLESHINISQALEIPLTDLYKDIVPSMPIEVRPKSKVFVHSKNTSSEILIQGARKIMPISIKISKGESTDKEATKPGVEKFIYMAQGKVEAIIGEERHNLTKGGIIYFDASLPHRFKNTGSGEACLICVVCPPIV